jgi:outer membrane protein assembly factor BamB
MKQRLLTLLTVVLLCSIPGWLSAENWPAWRGPAGVGTSSETGFPVKWSTASNIAWKVPLPGPGNSTPIIWGKRVFVSQASDEGRTRSLLCFSLADGTKLWEQSVRHEKEELTHKTNPQCASSPVTDGSTVVVWHGSAGLHAYDMDGNKRWSKDLGEFQHIWGTAASPVIFENRVILNCGPGLQTFWIGLDLSNGKEAWRAEAPDATSEKVEEFRGSWSTPVIHGSGEKAVMFLSMPSRLYAVNPRSGSVGWTCEGPSKLVYTSPLVTDKTVVTMSGYGGPSLAIRRGGSGDVTASHRLWYKPDKPDNPQRVGSGVIVGDHIYILNEPGIAWCIEVATGTRLWQKRLGSGGSWSSMCHVDGRLYVVNMEGTTFVLKPEPGECKVIAENKLEELTRGSLAFSQGKIVVRTYKHLYCIGE